MKIELLHFTPLHICAKAIRKCWASEDKSDTILKEHSLIVNEIDDKEYGYCTSEYGQYGVCGPKDKELIDRVGNKNKHSSTLEHLVYTFDIDGISRACLQEVARHRIASYSVKSTRYTLKELREHKDFTTVRPTDYLVGNVNTESINNHNIQALENLYHTLKDGVSNDIAKYCIPEAYKTSLVMTINARSLQNFLSLRTDKSALWEIRDLANELFTNLPEEHKYLFEHCIKEIK